MRKQFDRWYSRLTRTGKILFYAALVGVVWLLLQIINSIFNIVPPFRELGIGWLAVTLNIIAITLITFVVAQAVAIFYLMREESEMYREMMTKGRRRGSQMDQMTGHRNPASLTRRGARAQNAYMAGHLSVDNINQKYPSRWYKRPTKVADWKDIQEPGIYVLDSDSSTKVEIIDATELGAGFLVGNFEGNRFLKWKRKLVLNKRTGRPQSFSSLRNAKKQLTKFEE